MLKAALNTITLELTKWFNQNVQYNTLLFRWFSPGTPVSSTNKTNRRDITEILLKVTLSTITSNWQNDLFRIFTTILFPLYNFLIVLFSFMMWIDASLIHISLYSGHYGVMVFNATFINISAISWPSILSVEETEVPGEKHRPVASHWQTLSHYVVSSTPRHERGSNSQL